jgi:retinol dehydrogenase-14
MESHNGGSAGMKGKVVMVTGANAGMGKEISLALAGMGATLVMVCRDRERGEAARKDVISATGNQQVELLEADLSSQEFKGTHDRLNVLVNNAGMSMPTRHETVDGIETVFATNHLGPFLLSNLLLPALIAGAPSRVVTVSSGVQAMAKMDFDDLQGVKSYSEIRSYNQSKLANVLFTYELSRRLKGTGVTANVLEPGFIKTNLKVPFPFSLFSFMRGKPVDGAKPSIFLASSPEVEGVTGAFFNNKGIATKSSPLSYDEEAAKRLWQVSAQLTHLDAEERASPA